MIEKLSQVWSLIEAAARDAGAIRVGSSDLEDAHAGLFGEWIDNGHHATMQYLEKNRTARLNPASRFPWAKSVVVILVPYASERPAAPGGALSHGVARYALGDDYHVVLDRMLGAIEELLPAGIKTWRYVDTGPLSDRAFAAQAGLGWIGKNSMLIDEEIGSYVFIGTLLTSLENDIAGATVADSRRDFMARSAGQPDADADRAHLRHALREETKATVENVADNRRIRQG